MRVKTRLFLAILIGCVAMVVDRGAAQPVVDRASLDAYFQADRADRDAASVPAAATPLSRADARKLAAQVWTAWRRSRDAAELKKQINDRAIVVNGESMRFTLATMIDRRPENGYALFIAMHGGGATPPQVNDRAWRGMQKRYQVPGKYVCPRAPRDTWDHWHNEYVHPFFHRLVEGMILHEDVDPNRVYIMGYSSGGYGVFQLGPIIADRWAAVAVAAAGPTSARAENLRNLPLNLQVGTNDTAYDRFKVASEFADQMAQLRANDPDGYICSFIAHEGRGHGINDRSSVPWMAQFTRDPLPRKIVWVQGYETPWRGSNPVRQHFYWLAARPEYARVEGRTDSVTAERDGQSIRITAEGFEALRVRLNDDMLDLDKPVKIFVNDHKRFEGKIKRSLGVMLETFEEYHDPNYMFPAEVEVDVSR